MYGLWVVELVSSDLYISTVSVQSRRNLVSFEWIYEINRITGWEQQACHCSN